MRIRLGLAVFVCLLVVGSLASAALPSGQSCAETQQFTAAPAAPPSPGAAPLTISPSLAEALGIQTMAGEKEGIPTPLPLLGGYGSPCKLYPELGNCYCCWLYNGKCGCTGDCTSGTSCPN